MVQQPLHPQVQKIQLSQLFKETKEQSGLGEDGEEFNAYSNGSSNQVSQADPNIDQR